MTAQAKRVNQLYVIGGDGTHRGAYKLAELCWEKGVDVSVAGVPKTIDNDIGDSAWISDVFRTSSCVDGVAAVPHRLDALDVPSCGSRGRVATLSCHTGETAAGDGAESAV